jgi:endoglycosylceramidase
MRRHILGLLRDKRDKHVEACVLLCVIVSAFPVFATMTSAQSDTSGAQIPRLHTEGKLIKDNQGNVLTLHGVDFSGYESYPYDAYLFNHTEQDYQNIANWGFNVVRLPIAWQWIERIPNVYNDSYFTNFVDNDMQWANKYGIYIVLSFHQYGWSSYFTNVRQGATGLPTWMVSGYENSQAGITQCVNDFWQGKGPNGTDATVDNPSMQDRMVSAWKYIANRYKDKSNILGYDLFNEPPRPSFGTIDDAGNLLYPFYDRLIDNISTVDNSHIFVYEPIFGKWDLAPSLLDRPNVMFSFHLYTAYYTETANGYSGDISILQNQIKGYMNLPESNPSKNWSIPIFMGEFNAVPNYPNGDSWVSDLVDVCNDYNINWAVWDYQITKTYVPGSWSIIYPDKTEITGKLNGLDKPYPKSSSTPPAEFSFSRDTGLFEVTFNGSGNIETEIYVPYRYYSNVFPVNCTSNQWTRNWDEQSRTLTVNVSIQGTTQITIQGQPIPSVAEYSIPRNVAIIGSLTVVLVTAVTAVFWVRRKRRKNT